MRRIISILLFAAIVSTAMAIPAKPGTIRSITLSDGSVVQAELRGDEHVHYWQAADGRAFIQDAASDRFVLADVEAMRAEHEQKMSSLRRKSGMRHAAGQQPEEPLVGEMNGLIILVQFDDVKFKANHDLELYQNVANTEGFSNSMGFKGSVRDYYLSQSDGQLDYHFDVVGPVTLSHGYAYYGKNTNGKDYNMGEFVEEALNCVDDSVDFSKYDNDNDGVVDQVFFLYAGKGEADSSDANTIWPHMYYAYSGYGIEFYRNGVWVDVYACSDEVQGSGRVNGIGAICHEFSHCLGLPDMYDTAGGGNYGNDYWDIMNTGCYLGSTYVPCGYTAYERAYCGWRPLIELTDEVSVENLPALSDGGSAYAVYNDANRDEYYILEPRNTTGWDEYLPNYGLLIYHVDYKQSAWWNNTVNNTRNHQRCAIVAADNSYSTSWNNVKNDVWPYLGHDSFNDESTPRASWFNKNSVGTKDFRMSVHDIQRNADHTVNFKFSPVKEEPYEPDVPEGALFYESFGRCLGVGGNDGVYNGTSKLMTFVPDVEGWNAEDIGGAKECALVGVVGQLGDDSWVVTPEFNLEDGQYYKLSFRAAPYNIYTRALQVSVASGDAELSETTFSLVKNQWSDCETILKGNGHVKLQMTRYRPFYLDDVLIMPIDEETAGIHALQVEENNSGLYNLSGQKVGNAYKGIVIRNGRKHLNK